MSRTRAKKSFTLSSDALSVLVEFQKQVNAASLSAALEKLLQVHQEQKDLAALNANMASYYDNCTPEEAVEQQEWGEFASAQFVRIREAEGR